MTKQKERIKQTRILSDVNQDEFNSVGSVYLAQLPDQFVLFIGKYNTAEISYVERSVQ